MKRTMGVDGESFQPEATKVISDIHFTGYSELTFEGLLLYILAFTNPKYKDDIYKELMKLQEEGDLSINEDLIESISREPDFDEDEPFIKNMIKRLDFFL